VELHRAAKNGRRPDRGNIRQFAMKPDFPIAATGFEVIP
jgi:hypothetical protein